MRMNVVKVMMGLLVAVVFGMAGCGGGGSDNAPNNKITAANAGSTQNVVAGSLVTLNGSQSTGADGSLITYQWSITTKPAGSAATIINPTTVNPTFTPDLSGQYLVKLVITDSKSVTSEATVTITATVANAAPVANAGPSQTVITGALVQLGSSYGDFSGPLTYSWSFGSKPTGSNAALSSTTAANPTFTADVAGAYVANLIVNDGQANSLPASVTITANNPDPSAPSTPTGLNVTQVTSNSVSLSWTASTGGSGGVTGYTIYRNGTAIGAAAGTTYTDLSGSYNALGYSTAYTYTVSARSFADTYSSQSAPVTTTTLSAANLLSKLSPFIVFDTNTGKIFSQGYASPKLLGTLSPTDSHNVIVHQRVDTKVYKVTSLGNNQYTLTNFVTGQPFESPINAPVYVPLAGGNAMIRISMIDGSSTGYVSAPANSLLINVMDGGGGYLIGEIL